MKKNPIDRGRHSEIYITDRGTIIKKFKSKLAKNYEKEKYFLKKLNKYPFVPKMLSFDDNLLEIEMEYIKGRNLISLIDSKNIDDLLYTISTLLDILFLLDKLGIQKEELVRPHKHIILTDDYRIVLIDWERAKEKNNPSNVTQFSSFIINNKKLFDILNLEDRKKMLNLLREYKKTYSYKVLIKIKCELLCKTKII